MSLDRINAIICDKKYNSYLLKNEREETFRKFCHHNMSHYLDVARIAYIKDLENHLDLPKDIIYAVALLHDIGRWKQYKNDTPHEVASAELAREILIVCDFDFNEVEIIIEAILNHRNCKHDKDSLSFLIHISDKESRTCFSCTASKYCNWSDEEKNNKIKY